MRVHPLLQTDYGGCHEFRYHLLKMNIEHYLIHSKCFNENTEIERVNRTLKEDLDISGAKTYAELYKLIINLIYCNNYQRYHSAIEFITPYIIYQGNPEKIL